MLDLPTHKMQVNDRKMGLEPATSAQRPYTGVHRGWPACGGSESGQECVDIDVGQFLRLVGWVRETYRAVQHPPLGLRGGSAACERSGRGCNFLQR